MHSNEGAVVVWILIVLGVLLAVAGALVFPFVSAVLLADGHRLEYVDPPDSDITAANNAQYAAWVLLSAAYVLLGIFLVYFVWRRKKYLSKARNCWIFIPSLLLITAAAAALFYATTLLWTKDIDPSYLPTASYSGSTYPANKSFPPTNMEVSWWFSMLSIAVSGGVAAILLIVVLYDACSGNPEYSDVTSAPMGGLATAQSFGGVPIVQRSVRYGLVPAASL